MVENRSVGEVEAAYELVWHDLDGAEAITNSVVLGIRPK
jgi:hypothetical protein